MSVCASRRYPLHSLQLKDAFSFAKSRVTCSSERQPGLTGRQQRVNKVHPARLWPAFSPSLRALPCLCSRRDLSCVCDGRERLCLVVFAAAAVAVAAVAAVARAAAAARRCCCCCGVECGAVGLASAPATAALRNQALVVRTALHAVAARHRGSGCGCVCVCGCGSAAAAVCGCESAHSTSWMCVRNGRVEVAMRGLREPVWVR